MPEPRTTPVIVFDARPEAVTAGDPMPVYGLPRTVLTGRPGSQGEPGDENVLVLELGQEVPPDTPDGRIIYRLLEEI